MADHRSGGQGGGDVTTLTSITGLGVGEGAQGSWRWDRQKTRKWRCGNGVQWCGITGIIWQWINDSVNECDHFLLWRCTDNLKMNKTVFSPSRTILNKIISGQFSETSLRIYPMCNMFKGKHPKMIYKTAAECEGISNGYEAYVTMLPVRGRILT